MIVYKELSSLCDDLGFTSRALYTASNSVYKHYHDIEIPKGNEETRLLHIPDDFMKSIQKSILDNILVFEPISPYAKAYRIGGSTKSNAAPHVGMPVVMKCDIRKFFDHITFPMLRDKVFPESRFSRSNSILLSALCVYEDSIPQGAPTSPAVSNIILRGFDDRVGSWCEDRNITYTRYCDDMTFSGSFVPCELKQFVEKELFREGFFLNHDKTVVLHQGQRIEITGIVVNEKISIPKFYKKSIRQEIYYCQKYGIASHIEKKELSESVDSYKKKLLGRLNYILSVEPGNDEIMDYKSWLKEQ